MEGVGFRLWSANLEGKGCGDCVKAADDVSGDGRLPAQG